MADHDHDEELVSDLELAAAEAEAAHHEEVAAKLEESSAERPEPEEGESTADYITRLRNLQVANVRKR